MRSFRALVPTFLRGATAPQRCLCTKPTESTLGERKKGREIGHSFSDATLSFDQIDLDGDGYVNRDEWAKALSAAPESARGVSHKALRGKPVAKHILKRVKKDVAELTAAGQWGGAAHDSHV